MSEQGSLIESLTPTLPCSFLPNLEIESVAGPSGVRPHRYLV